MDEQLTSCSRSSILWRGKEDEGVFSTGFKSFYSHAGGEEVEHGIVVLCEPSAATWSGGSLQVLSGTRVLPMRLTHGPSVGLNDRSLLFQWAGPNSLIQIHFSNFQTELNL
jgi:hypothetical protein